MPANRDKTGRFIKGAQSPNPTGRPKLPTEFKALAKEKSLDALRAVIEIVENRASDPKDVIAGARLIIEYAHGKPRQEVEATVNQSGDFVLELTGEKEGCCLKMANQGYKRQPH